MRLQKSFFIVMLSMYFASAFAQNIKEFTHDKETYFSELEEYLTNPSSAELKKLVKHFYTVWDSGNFGGDQQEYIYANSDLLLKKRAAKSPHFKNYLKVLISFHTHEQSQESFDAWSISLKRMLEAKNMAFSSVNSFFEETIDILEMNTLYSGNALLWKFEGERLYYSLSPTNEHLQLKIEGFDIYCITPRDSFLLNNLTGIYYPLEKKLVGESGKIIFPTEDDLEKASEVTFKEFNINCKTDYVKIEHSHFYNDTLFSTEIEGILEAKTEEIGIKDTRTYPRFTSYDTDLKIKNLIPNSILLGRLYVIGKNLAGKAGDKNIMQISMGTKPIFKFNFGKYLCTHKSFRAETSEMVIYMESDSMYHSNVEINYSAGKRKLNIINLAKNYEPESFVDSYHQLSISAENLEWQIDSTTLQFKRLPGSGYNRSVFESVNFFNEAMFLDNQAGIGTHPVMLLSRFANLWGASPFKSKDFARIINSTQSDAQQIMGLMAAKGYIRYNMVNDSAIILPKVYMDMRAYAKKGDYDIIRFGSNTVSYESNASLDLNNNDLYIKGVKKLPVFNKVVERKFKKDSINYSYIDSFDIQIYPKNGEVYFKKDRNFSFAGVVNAGSFTFVGNSFSFSYNDFFIKMDSVKKLEIVLNSLDSLGKMNNTGKPVSNYLENVTGYLYIDNPGNKSALVTDTIFPTLTTSAPAFVYYSDSTINKVSYPRDSVYFKANAFTINNLFYFNAENWKIGGTFESGGILPTMNTNLSVQTDTIKQKDSSNENLSFGFTEPIDSAGLAVYKGKGMLFSAVKVSTEGIRGIGKLKYLSSETVSDNLLFEPSRMTCFANTFNLLHTEAGTVNRGDSSIKVAAFPKANATMLNINWDVPGDSLVAKTDKNKIKIYEDIPFKNDTFNLIGSVVVTPEGLKGNGKLQFGNSTISSKKYDFETDEFKAVAEYFTHKLQDSDDYIFKSTNTDVHIFLPERFGNFSSNDSTSNVEFPLNNYSAYMREFDWYMDKNKIELKSDMNDSTNIADADSTTKVYQEGGKFVQKNNNPIEFFSQTGVYDFDKLELRANKVDRIKIADSYLMPSDTVVILKGGVIARLMNADLLLGMPKPTHYFSNCEIDIESKIKFNAKGYFQYKNSTIEKVPIYFEYLTQKGGVTMGETSIADSLFIPLSAYFNYYGKIGIAGNDPKLKYRGFVQINHICDSLEKPFFSVQSEMDTENIQFQISDQVYTNQREKLYSGIIIKNNSDSVYASFFNTKNELSDIVLYEPKGYLVYDKTDDNYKFGDLAKIKSIENPGTLIALNRTVCILRNFGKPELKLETAPLKLELTGRSNFILDKGELETSAFLDLNFHFPAEALTRMAKVLNEDISLEGIDFSNKIFHQNLVEFTDSIRAEAAMTNIATKGEFNLEEAEKSTILFTKLDLLWNNDARSFQSAGLIGVGWINGTPVNKLVEGHLEIARKSTSSVISLYLEIDAANWFFFRYEKGEMLALSSDSEFNTIITDIKEKDRHPPKGDKNTPYAFYPAQKAAKDKFLDKIRGVEIDEEE